MRVIKKKKKFWVQGSGREATPCRVQGSGFRVQGVQGSRFRVQGSGFRCRVQGSVFSVQGSEFTGLDSRCMLWSAGFRVCRGTSLIRKRNPPPKDHLKPLGMRLL